jgi:hypothetical protein
MASMLVIWEREGLNKTASSLERNRTPDGHQRYSFFFFFIAKYIIDQSLFLSQFL